MRFSATCLTVDPDGFIKMLREQAADLQNPPVMFAELLNRLTRVVPELVACANISTTLSTLDALKMAQ